jgi:hypothetical protein
MLIFVTPGNHFNVNVNNIYSISNAFIKDSINLNIISWCSDKRRNVALRRCAGVAKESRPLLIPLIGLSLLIVSQHI